MTEIKPCPFRVHGEKKASLTVMGEYYYNEYFMPCLQEKCPCYVDVGNEIRCLRDNTYIVLAERKEEFDCNDCYYSMQNCNDISICCEDETALCDNFEPEAEFYCSFGERKKI